MDAMQIDPLNSDRMMYGTGATLYGTNSMTALDRDENVNISVFAKGIEETAVLGLISPPSGAPLLSHSEISGASPRGPDQSSCNDHQSDDRHQH